LSHRMPPVSCDALRDACKSTTQRVPSLDLDCGTWCHAKFKNIPKQDAIFTLIGFFLLQPRASLCISRLTQRMRA